MGRKFPFILSKYVSLILSFNARCLSLLSRTLVGGILVRRSLGLWSVPSFFSSVWSLCSSAVVVGCVVSILRSWIRIPVSGIIVGSIVPISDRFSFRLMSRFIYLFGHLTASVTLICYWRQGEWQYKKTRETVGDRWPSVIREESHLPPLFTGQTTHI